MIKLTVDQALRANLHNLDERLEICDQAGRVLGYFTPAVDRLNDDSSHRALSRLRPDPVIEFYKKDVDRSLLRENLKLTVEQRLEKLTELARFADELRRAGREARKAQ